MYNNSKYAILKNTDWSHLQVICLDAPYMIFKTYVANHGDPKIEQYEQSIKDGMKVAKVPGFTIYLTPAIILVPGVKLDNGIVMDMLNGAAQFFRDQVAVPNLFGYRRSAEDMETEKKAHKAQKAERREAETERKFERARTALFEK